MKRSLGRVLIALLVLAGLFFFACAPETGEIATEVEGTAEEIVTEEATPTEEPAEEITTTKETPAEETPAAPTEEATQEQPPAQETNAVEETKNILEETVLDFLSAVKSGDEYKYYSSATKKIVGTEQEYKNGTKSDIFFIVYENHANWENVQVTKIELTSVDKAEVTIKGDREAEGIEYVGDEVTFRLILENGNWKIDFFSY